MVQKIAIPAQWPMPRYALGQAVWIHSEFCLGLTGSIVGLHFDPDAQEWTYSLSPHPGSEAIDGFQPLEDDLAPLHPPLCF